MSLSVQSANCILTFRQDKAILTGSGLYALDSYVSIDYFIMTSENVQLITQMLNGFIQIKYQITYNIIQRRETKINDSLSHKNTNVYVVNRSNISYFPNQKNNNRT